MEESILLGRPSDPPGWRGGGAVPSLCMGVPYDKISLDV